MRGVLVASLIVASIAGFVPARAAGCEVVATGHPSVPNDCTYVATGSGMFDVASVSGFRIEIVDPAPRRQTLVAQVALHNQPVSGIAVRTGALDTRAGDVVKVSIGIAQFDPGEGMEPLRYQDGVIRARDV